MEELVKLFLEHWPIITGSIIILGVTIQFTYKVTTKYHHWTNKITTSEIHCAKINGIENKMFETISTSDALESKIDSHGEKFSTIGDKIFTIDKNLSALITFLSVKHNDLQSDFFRSHSPIQLTETGIDLLNNSGGKEYVENHIETILIEMELQNFKSGLDVQNYSYTFPVKNFSSDGFIKIRDYIYQHPVFKSGPNGEILINEQIITQIIGIYIRDKYFEKHPELKDKD